MGCAECWKCCIVTCQNGKDTGESVACARCCRVTVVSVLKWIPVLLIWAILIWSYYVYVFIFCLVTVQVVHERVAYLIVYHIIAFFLVLSYLQTVFTDVNQIPKQYNLSEEDKEKLKQKMKREERRSILEKAAAEHNFLTVTKDGETRYCDRCMIIKPDRCHHCSICQACVLKMDHHCPWTNNCVGFYNYKVFLLLNFYGALLCIFTVATVTRFLVAIYNRHEPVDFLTGNLLMCVFASVMFATLTLSLLGYHAYLIAINKTTLETFYPAKFKEDSHKTFSWGCGQNFKQVFGSRMLLWLIPVFSSEGDGVTFPIVSSSQKPASYDTMGTTDVEAQR